MLQPAEGSPDPGDASWYSQEAISRRPAAGSHIAGVDFPESTTLALVWEGAAGSAESAALLALPGDEPFRRAVQSLVAGAAADGFARVELPAGPDQIPSALADKVGLTLNQDQTAYAALTWRGPLLDDDARALRRWAQIPEFAAAVEQLIKTVATFAIEEALPPERRRPTDQDLPDVLQQHVLIRPESLAWDGPKADDAQMAALQALAQQGDEPFQNAVAEIIKANQDAQPDHAFSHNVQIPPEQVRPMQTGLPDVLQKQLVIEPAKVRWTGWPATPEQLKALQELAQHGDPPFQQALSAVLAQLGEPASAPFALPIRPQPADVPALLRDRLLLGRALIRYHGVLPRETGRGLQALFDDRPDRQAIQRLHNASQGVGLRGRQLLIRARRGSAAPGDMQPLAPDAL